MKNDLFEYSIIENGICIDEYISDETELIIPNIIDGNPVKIIGKKAFFMCSNLTSVIIPDGLTSIGEFAFRNCKNLTNIIIPNSVQNIEKHAFNGCKKLTNITMPSSLTDIASYAFYGCESLKNVTLPDNLKSIGDSAFGDCSSITNITIPNNIKSIGKGAFSACTNLKTLTLPMVVEHIGDMFGGYSLANYNNVVHDSLKEIIITSTTTIANYMFNGCSSLTSITIPDSVTSIGNDAFSGCSSLKNLTIPDKVQSIGKGAFSYCNSLESLTIPSGVTNIGYGAFSGCSSLKDITIPDSVTAIKESSFKGCSSLTQIRISNITTEIGNSAFSDCSSLTSIEIPSSVTSIGEFAFENCKNLTDIIIPNAITSVKNYTFYGCERLKNIVIPSSVTSIGESAFHNCTNLANVTMSEGLTAIGYYAFSGCSSLTDITIPSSVTSIEATAFSYCDNLTNIIVEKENEVYYSKDNCIVEKATNKLIFGCKNSIIPSSVTSIGEFAFRNCYGLTSIIIPASVIEIEDYAFIHCENLISITVDKNTIICDDAFYGCENLKKTINTNNLKTEKHNMFEFGRYPQTLKKGDVTIDLTSSKNGKFTGSDGEQYVQRNGNFYKIEPIKWRILKETETQYKLISDKILDKSIYAVAEFDDGWGYYAFSEDENLADDFITNEFFENAFSVSEKSQNIKYIYLPSVTDIIPIEEINNIKYYNGHNCNHESTDYAGVHNGWWLMQATGETRMRRPYDFYVDNVGNISTELGYLDWTKEIEKSTIDNIKESKDLTLDNKLFNDFCAFDYQDILYEIGDGDAPFSAIDLLCWAKNNDLLKNSDIYSKIEDKDIDMKKVLDNINSGYLEEYIAFHWFAQEGEKTECRGIVPILIINKPEAFKGEEVEITYSIIKEGKEESKTTKGACGTKLADLIENEENILVNYITRYYNGTIEKELWDINCPIYEDSEFEINYIKPNCMVKYVLNGGTVSCNEEEIAIGEEYLLNPAQNKIRKNELMWEICKFDGWYLDSELTKKIEKLNPSTSEEIVLYAKWQDAEINDDLFLKVDANYNATSLENAESILFGEFPQQMLPVDEESTLTRVKGDIYANKVGDRYLKIENDTFKANDKIISGQDGYYRISPIEWKINNKTNIGYQLVTNKILVNNSFTKKIDGIFVAKYADIFDYFEDKIAPNMLPLGENDLKVKKAFANSKCLNAEIFGHRGNTNVKYPTDFAISSGVEVGKQGGSPWWLKDETCYRTPCVSCVNAEGQINEFSGLDTIGIETVIAEDKDEFGIIASINVENFNGKRKKLTAEEKKDIHPRETFFKLEKDNVCYLLRKKYATAFDVVQNKNSTNNGEIIIHSKIEYQGNEYIVNSFYFDGFFNVIKDENMVDAFCNSELDNRLIIKEIKSIKEKRAPIFNSITSIILEEGISEIDKNSFADFDNLKDIVIPTSITTIEEDTFRHNQDLTIYCKVNEDEEGYSYDFRYTSNRIIYNYAGEKGITDDGFEWALLNDGNVCIIGNARAKEDLIIPDSINGSPVTIICDNAKFKSSVRDEEGSYCFKNIKFPNQLQKIGNDVFKFISNLVKISLPSTVNYIGERAFYLCKNLTEINYEGTKKEWKKININNINGAYGRSKKKKIVHCIDGDVNI